MSNPRPTPGDVEGIDESVDEHGDVQRVQKSGIILGNTDELLYAYLTEATGSTLTLYFPDVDRDMAM